MTQATSQYIPAGRTARFASGEKEIQVQTEFAPRPTPRITSTILVSGEVVKKLETPLESPISNSEELNDVERMLLKQHSAVLQKARDIIEEKQSLSAFDTLRARLNLPPKKTDVRKVKETDRPTASEERVTVNEEVKPSTFSDSDRISVAKRTTLERLYTIEGVSKAHTLSCDGIFLSEKSRNEFKKQFPKIVKHLSEMVEIFGELPNGRGRENGVYEVESGKLYLVSHCGFMYLLVMTRKPPNGAVEEVVRKALGS